MNSLSKLIKKHDELSWKLTIENKEAYDNIVIYLRASNLSQWDVEEAIEDVLEMLLSAQERGECGTDIFGESLQYFCDEIIYSYGEKVKIQKRKERTSLVISIFLIIFTMDYIMTQLPSISAGKQDYLSVHYSLDSFLASIFLIIGEIVISKVIGNVVFKISYIQKNILTGILWITLLFGLTSIPYGYENIHLFTLPVYIIVPVVIGAFVFSQKLSKVPIWHQKF